ncbi:hypothetical protein WME79_17135 [Sorangium sp. So ce726]|uniref:hypothetical protein n=1 Tax=Sorangium sp. So ce726 TaxID=3133319 RepID=UPI003F602107
MPTPVERPRYFEGEYLSTDDYVAEQVYQDGLRRAHDGALHTWGIASGLEVSLASGQVTVAPGVAVGSDGELVVLAEPARLELPTGGETLLVLEREEVRLAPDRPEGLPRIRDTAALSWAATAGAEALVLAALSAGPALDASPRRYVGMNVGSVAFSDPSITARAPSIVGWGAGPEHGLRINAGEVRFRAPQGAGAELLLRDGLLGVGAMRPEAALDVQAPNAPSEGLGLISSIGATVTGSDPLIGAVVAPGDTIITTNRNGQPVEGKVLSVLDGGRLEMDTALDAQSASWELRRRLVARFSSASRALLVADGDALVGIGVSAPSVRLEIAGGDLLLGAGPRRITFADDGQILSKDGDHAISFDRTSARLTLRDRGEIALVAGSATSGLSLLPSGDVGLGTKTPGNPLVVDGTVYATEGYVFPDGTVQIDAGIAVPIGGIIDWWRPGSIPQNLVEYRICDGSVVDDKASPFNGKAVPNLGGYFIRGCASQADAGPGPGASETHVHGYVVPAHTHPFPHAHPDYSGQTGGGDSGDSTKDDLADQFCLDDHTHAFTANIGAQTATDTGPNSDAGTTATTEAGSSLPPYCGLLKLIRIR